MIIITVIAMYILEMLLWKHRRDRMGVRVEERPLGICNTPSDG